MNCNTTHYRANSSSVPGDPTYREVFGMIARAVSEGTLRTLLECEPLAPLFKVR